MRIGSYNKQNIEALQQVIKYIIQEQKRKQRKEEGELVNRGQIGKQQRIILNKWKQRLKKNKKVFKLKLTIDIRLF